MNLVFVGLEKSTNVVLALYKKIINEIKTAKIIILAGIIIFFSFLI